MKVCIIGSFPPSPSGIADYNYFMIKELANELDVFCLTDNKIENISLENVQIKPLSDYHDVFTKCDLLHFQFGNNPFDAFVLGIFKKSVKYYQKPVVSTLHDMDLMTTPTLFLTLLKNKKQLLHLSSLLQPLEGIFKESDKIIVHSNYAKKIFIDRFGRDENIEVIRHGMPVDEIRKQVLDSTGNIMNGDFILSSFGYIFPRKGYEEVIKALKLLQENSINFKYVLIGGSLGVYKRYLEYLFKRYGLLNNVEFVGYIPRERLSAYFKTSNVLLQPRRIAIEGCSGSLLHALCTGVPLVASNVGYHNEYVIDNKTGILVEHTPEGIYEGVLELYSNPSWGSVIGENAYNWCKANIDWSIIIKEYIKLYQELV